MTSGRRLAPSLHQTSGCPAFVPGFTLTADEIGRISARQLSFDVRGLGNPGTSNQPDLLIRDLSLTGSRNNGSELVRIFTGGDGPGGIVVGDVDWVLLRLCIVLDSI